MIALRKSQERGQADHGWLKSFHSFSFADYYDPEFMGFRDLRVINEDYIAGGGGFPTHGHKDMEILTYVIDGELKHKDSEGNAEAIVPGEIQKMSAGSGIHHSEFNGSDKKDVHLLQIWLMPNKRNIPPGYQQEKIDWSVPGLKLIAGPKKGKGTVELQQDALVYAGKIKDEAVHFDFKTARYYWIQLISGELSILGQELKAGDALAFKLDKDQTQELKGNAHFLLFDLN